MKKPLLLGIAVLIFSACTPSVDEEIVRVNAPNSVVAHPVGGLVEIPIEYKGDYRVISNSSNVNIVSSKALQVGKIVVSVTPNFDNNDRESLLDIKTADFRLIKQVSITQKPVARVVSFADIVDIKTLCVIASPNIESPIYPPPSLMLTNFMRLL